MADVKLPEGMPDAREASTEAAERHFDPTELPGDPTSMWEDLVASARSAINERDRQWSAECDRLRQRAEEAERERDAYKKAKQENDERFMAERDSARAENARLRAERDHLKGREQTIMAAVGPVADGGQYRADIVSAIDRIKRERDAARAELAAAPARVLRKFAESILDISFSQQGAREAEWTRHIARLAEAEARYYDKSEGASRTTNTEGT